MWKLVKVICLIHLIFSMIRISIFFISGISLPVIICAVVILYIGEIFFFCKNKKRVVDFI